MNYQEIELIDNIDKHRFELWAEEKCSFIDYKLEGNHLILVHTEVPQELEGRGIAAALVEKTLQYLQEHNLKMQPLCSYIQVYLKRHPEWEIIVT